MRWHIIKALVAKDLSLFFRSRFFALMTVVGFVLYIAIYFLMPRSIDETMKIGMYASAPPPIFQQIAEEGLEINTVDTEPALKEAVTEGDYIAGIALPENMMEKLLSGQKATVNLYFAADTPTEIKDAIATIIRELGYMQMGQALVVDITEEVLGPDMLGMQIPPRDRMRPLLVVILIIFETLGMANLIAEEVERGTVRALLVTPMSVVDLIVAKGITGLTLAFGQGILFMTIAGGMSRQPLVMATALLLGGLMATGVAFLVASLGKDFMTVLGWGILAFIVLMIPAFGVLLPGTFTGWVKVIPSYYLVNTVYQSASFSAGWGDVWQNLLILLGFDAALLGGSIMALRRKLR
ncbi:ABC transporter permease [Chloroflexota bacterium]